eukprot:TRINITY_DN7289_c0_g1_i2.p1 TRINITY_DN7289_c0_g1~~TRINITY_DN7289_c0_g1_i2.p1  ORF type:complete len:760 (+),score=200.46 TRINITY_DN7289_c0_g1_i2:106-2385(+)
MSLDFDLSSDDEDRDELMAELAQALDELPEEVLLGTSQRYDPSLSQSNRSVPNANSQQALTRSSQLNHTQNHTQDSAYDGRLFATGRQPTNALLMQTHLDTSQRSNTHTERTSARQKIDNQDQDEPSHVSAQSSLRDSVSSSIDMQTPAFPPPAAETPNNLASKLAAIVTGNVPAKIESDADDYVHLTPPQLHILYRAECRKTRQLQALLEEQQAAYEAQRADLEDQLESMQASSKELVEEITAVTNELRQCQLHVQDRTGELESVRRELRESQHARGLAEAGEAAARDEVRRLEAWQQERGAEGRDDGSTTNRQLASMQQQHEAVVAGLRQQMSHQQQQHQDKESSLQSQIVLLERQLRLNSGPGPPLPSDRQADSSGWSTIDELLAMSEHSSSQETDQEETEHAVDVHWHKDLERRCELLELRLRHHESASDGDQVPESDVDLLRQELGKALAQADAWSRTCLQLRRQTRAMGGGEGPDAKGQDSNSAILAQELQACEAEKQQLQQQLATAKRQDQQQEVAQYRQLVERLTKQVASLVDEKELLQRRLESQQETAATDIAQARQAAQDESAKACRQVVNALKDRLINVKSELAQIKAKQPDVEQLQRRLEAQAKAIAQQQQQLVDQANSHAQATEADEASSAEALSHLHDRYEATLTTIQQDLQTHLAAARLRTTEFIERSVLRERYVTALKLNSYYITAMARLLAYQGVTQSGENSSSRSPNNSDHHHSSFRLPRSSTPLLHDTIPENTAVPSSAS